MARSGFDIKHFSYLADRRESKWKELRLNDRIKFRNPSISYDNILGVYRSQKPVYKEIKVSGHYIFKDGTGLYPNGAGHDIEEDELLNLLDNN